MKIRAVTVGAPLRAPVSSDGVAAAGIVARAAAQALAKAGWDVQTTRLATPPLHTIVSDPPPGAVLDFATALEAAATREDIAYVALGAIDTFQESDTWQPLLDAVPDVIAGTRRTFCAAMVATRARGINLAATRACGDLVAHIARLSEDGFGNLRFAALANCPPDIPFFPAAYHGGNGGGNGAMTLGIALEAADVASAAFAGAAGLEDAQTRLVETLTREVRSVVETVRAALAGRTGVRFSGVDLSLAPFPADDRSIAGAFENLGLPAFGASGTLFLASFLTACLQRVAAAVGPGSGAGTRRFGFSGLMLPVLEDSVLARRAAEGTFGVDSLLLYAAVCGLGLDTVPLPGDTPPGELGAIILDVAALAVRLDKPLTARLFPVPGKRAGDAVAWDFAFFAPSRVLPVRGHAPGGALAQATAYNPML